MQLADLDQLADVDGTIESSAYLHLNEAGESPARSWGLEERPLRQKRIDPNPMGDDVRFVLKQIVTGADEGLALAAEHEEQVVGLLAAQPQLELNTLRLVDLRVDYDYRRQGLASAMLFQAIQKAREEGQRAVSIETRTDNQPANTLLGRLHFELSGIDTRRRSNHDLVEEAVTLFWYIPLSD
jgi:ribosomal protein S18 acetylase RimI-like enzyme